MMKTKPPLEGWRVALLESRMGGELAGLVRRQGATPVAAPAVREEALHPEAEVAAFLDELAAGAFRAVVFSTGVGADALFREAERQGRLAELRAGLNRVITVCRGPKPAAVLKRAGVPVKVAAREPHTTIEVLEAMARLDLSGAGVAVVHYGERNPALTESLRARGVRLNELCLYEWRLPGDIGPLRALVADVLDGRVDAVVFTSQVQARHLFQVAAEVGKAEALAEALNAKTVVAAVGPTCSAALQSLGVWPQVVPEHPKMGHLVNALAAYAGAHQRHVGSVAFHRPERG